MSTFLTCCSGGVDFWELRVLFILGKLLEVMGSLLEATLACTMKAITIHVGRAIKPSRTDGIDFIHMDCQPGYFALT